MKKTQPLSIIGVNGTKYGASPSRKPDDEQVGPDRHSVTAKDNKDNKKTIRRRWKKNTSLIATWNVRTLFQPGKLENVIKEMERLKWKVLDLSEMRWNDQGTFFKDGHCVCYSGNNSNTHGVGFMVDKSLGSGIKGFMPISDRVALMKLKLKHKTLCILPVYAPTADSEEAEILKFYD